MKLNILIVLSILFIRPLFADGEYKENRQWWIDSYGQVTREEVPRIDRVTRIFRKIWRAARPVDIEKPRLIFLPASAEKWLDSWAVSIRDGTVILVISVLPLAFEIDGANPAIGDARMAFVLSHELAHLIHHDHERLGVPLLFQILSTEKELALAKEAEFRADRAGLFLMTLAGYHPQHVLKHRSRFFLEYARKIRKKIRSIDSIKNQTEHADITERADELRHRLRTFARQLRLFREGVRAYGKNDFRGAEKSFLQFAKFYPGREVLNNIGLSLFRQARMKVNGCSEICYRLIPATLIASETDARKMIPKETPVSVGVRPKKRCQPAAFKKILFRSKQYLIHARNKDPAYLPARINLSAAGFMNPALKTTEARSGKGLLPKNDYLLINRALEAYSLNPRQNRQQAIQALKKIAVTSPVYKIAKKNLALIAPGKNTGEFYKTPLNQEINPEILNSVEKQ